MNHPSATTSAGRGIHWLLFILTFVSFAYFNQGGGWNQNARFAMVRAIVEEGHLWIDSYLVYSGSSSGQGTRLIRVPVRNAEFSLAGKNYAFQWQSPDGRMVPLNNPSGEDKQVSYVDPEQFACTGDLAFHDGHFHPAKAPGGAFVAVPAYFVIHSIELLAGIDPDSWWALTLNAWLTTVLSVGLLSALGSVLFYRIALSLSGGRTFESLLTSLAFAFGTMFFPYGTALYEHNVIAVLLLASFYLLHRVREATTSAGPLSYGRERLYLSFAGLCAGFAAITNYIMAVVVVLLGGYLLLAVRRKGGLRWFALGILGPFLMICSYNMACFSTPFTTNYAFENPVFKSGSTAFLDVFLLPQWDVLPAVLFSPYRGLFFSSPVLILGVIGLFCWLRDDKMKAEAVFMISVLVFFLLFIMTFNGWHGGWAVGPRYLAPALPFLALPMVVGFRRFFRTACALTILSAAISFLVTAVDPQAPVGNARFAMIEDRPEWLHSPLTDYLWPLFTQGHAGPLLRSQRDQVLRFFDGTMKDQGTPSPVRLERLVQYKEEIDAAIRSGEPAPLLIMKGPDGRPGAGISQLSTIVGPVSVNPTGVYEGWMYRIFPPHSLQADRNSFNLGEFLFEKSRWSLLPLATLAAILATIALRMARVRDLHRNKSNLSGIQGCSKTTP